MLGVLMEMQELVEQLDEKLFKYNPNRKITLIVLGGYVIQHKYNGNSTRDIDSMHNVSHIKNAIKECLIILFIFYNLQFKYNIVIYLFFLKLKKTEEKKNEN
jgi:hypothetical protein